LRRRRRPGTGPRHFCHRQRVRKGECPMKALIERPLGNSGLRITQVGFGAWAIGGGGWAYGWGSQDDADSVAAIRHAVARGINWVDTAAIYGLGHSEEVVGRALREIPAAERPYVFTKGGMVPDPARPFDEPQRNLSPSSIRKEVEASLRRLGVERIDLYQFHWPDAVGTPVEDSWGEMSRLIEEGKVRAGGVSNFDVGLLERAKRIRHVDSLQPPFSLIRRQSAADVIPWSASSGTGVGARSPEQVEGWIAAGPLTLEPRGLAEIAGALERTQAGAGPIRPEIGAPGQQARAAITDAR